MFYLYNFQTKQKVPFEAVNRDDVKIYVCGPTVWDDAHLGHGRSSIVFDLLYRTLCALGYKVMLAKNFTDIDDKIINRAKKENVSYQEIATRYIQSYIRDMDELNITPPSLTPHATKSIDEIIKFIQALLDSKIAYKNSAGDIYLDVSQDEKYGSLSQRGINDENISRIESAHKKNPRDFALWKRDDSVGFHSPMGHGRPGWHIECSAMIENLAHKDGDFCVDIHGGGLDLLFPHHENEACQTRLYKKREIAKYWMHNAFVNINGEKMSKSLNNSFFIKDALRVYGGEVLRNYLLGTHYRSILDFNEHDLLASKKRLDKIYYLKKRLLESNSSMKTNTGYFDYEKKFLSALCDDLNISVAFSVLEEFLAHANKELDSKSYALIGQMQNTLTFMCNLLGLGTHSVQDYFQMGVSAQEIEKINSLIQRRAVAKSEKNYALADEIRSELKEMGIALLDSKDGTTWEKI